MRYVKVKDCTEKWRFFLMVYYPEMMSTNEPSRLQTDANTGAHSVDAGYDLHEIHDEYDNLIGYLFSIKERDGSRVTYQYPVDGTCRQKVSPRGFKPDLDQSFEILMYVMVCYGINEGASMEELQWGITVMEGCRNVRYLSTTKKSLDLVHHVSRKNWNAFTTDYSLDFVKGTAKHLRDESSELYALGQFYESFRHQDIARAETPNGAVILNKRRRGVFDADFSDPKTLVQLFCVNKIVEYINLNKT